MTHRLALTLGDPAGIGPEIAARLLADADERRDLVAVGSAWHLELALSRVAPDLALRRLDDVVLAPAAGTVDIFDVPTDSEVSPGEVCAAGGDAAHRAVVRAVQAVADGRVRGIVTGPINKEALAAANVPYPGHTEMLADLAGGAEVSMMLFNPQLRVVLVTVHVALAAVPALLDVAGELRAIRHADAAARALGASSPRVAVAGLNPHAGEGGLFGDEEAQTVAPAVATARAEGLDVHGPLPGDTVFMRARAGEFDIVVAQYHDQGLIPVKYSGLDDGVNVTLGLPFVRTSVDHGTAMDIAGRGIASPDSLRAAVRAARRLTADSVAA